MRASPIELATPPFLSTVLLGGAGLARFEDLASYGRRARTLGRLVAFLDHREASHAPAAALMYTTFALAVTPQANCSGDHAAIAAMMPNTGRDGTYRACMGSRAAHGNFCAVCGAMTMATVQLFARRGLVARRAPSWLPPVVVR